MTTRTFSFLKGSSLSVLAGALLLSTTSIAPGNPALGLSALNGPNGSGKTTTDIFHHWPNVAFDTARIDSKIFHHWPNKAASVAAMDPTIFHHWPYVAVMANG